LYLNTPTTDDNDFELVGDLDISLEAPPPRAILRVVVTTTEEEERKAMEKADDAALIGRISAVLSSPSAECDEKERAIQALRVLQKRLSLREGAEIGEKPTTRLIRLERSSIWNNFGYSWQEEPYFYPQVHVYKMSPANAAGLRTGDRILAINGTNTIRATTTKVHSLLAQNKYKRELLVITEAGAEWYERNGLPMPIPAPEGKNGEEEETDLSTQAEKVYEETLLPAWNSVVERTSGLFDRFFK
ncbi:hypothetical protein PFISCL1PPCAC_3020, partial [Pristionchus fissidentatus]